MKIEKKIIYAFLLLFLSSCGSFEDEKKFLLQKPEKKDLVNSFDIAKDQAVHYEEKEHSEAKKVETKVVVTKAEPKVEPKVGPEKKKGKIKEKKKASAKIEEPAKIVAPVKIEEPVKAEPVKTEGSSYPDDYPALLKDYDANSKAVWEKFVPPFYKNEQSILAISYLGVVAGYITVTSKDIVKLGDRLAYHYLARFKSKEIYSYFYWLDDNLETFIDKEKFLPMKYSLIQREKRQNVDDLQLFDFNKMKVFTWYKRVKVGSDKNEHLEKYIPRYLQDSFSALQFVRGLPLKKGDHYDFPVSTRGDTWLLKTEVIGEEVISVNDEDVKAIRLRAETHFPGVLQKSGDINFWYAADPGRRLLKFQAKVKIGSIYGELVEYKPGVLEK